MRVCILHTLISVLKQVLPFYYEYGLFKFILFQSNTVDCTDNLVFIDRDKIIKIFRMLQTFLKIHFLNFSRVILIQFGFMHHSAKFPKKLVRKHN